MGQIPGAVAGDIVDHSIYLDNGQFIGNRDGSQKVTFGASGITITGSQTYAAGTAAAPSIAFATATGFYGVTTSVLGLAIAGVAGLAIAGSSPTLAAATDTVGQDVYIKAAAAGGTATAARVGGLISIASGAGSAATGAFAGGAGGAFGSAAGAGGANTGGASGEAGGAGGANTKVGGAGGATNSTGAHVGGVGGASTQVGGVGGAQTGAAQAGGAGGASGSTGGVGGASTSGTGGAGGACASAGGLGGAGVTGGAGGAASLTGGAGGAGGTTGGAGGAVTIVGGNAGSGGNVSGGNVGLAGGTGTGTGIRGVVNVTGFRGNAVSPAAITTTTTLIQADSGGVFSVSQASAYDIDLPSPTTGAGLMFDFYLTGPAANNVTITVLGAAATFVGTIVNDVTSVIPATGSTLTFASGAAALGDNISIRSISASLYLVRAVTSAAGGITIT